LSDDLSEVQRDWSPEPVSALPSLNVWHLA
jgi:hypothetical protein